MAADFIFFIGIAAICFSGLLYTLHSLGESRGLERGLNGNELFAPQLPKNGA